MPLIGMFTNLKATDPEKVMRRNAFLIGLQAEVASSPNLKRSDSYHATLTEGRWKVRIP